MILEYHRPVTLDEALSLLQRPNPKTVPLGGGSTLNQPSVQEYAVVDLQNLGLNTIEERGNILTLGATVSLQNLLESSAVTSDLGQVIRHEATYNLRQVATIAGTLVAADGRSPLTTACLALDATLTMLPGDENLSLGDLLPVRGTMLAGRLITQITFPLNVSFAYDYVARTPADWPLVCVAVVRWPAGRTRIALGGYGPAPTMVFDGPELDGALEAAKDAYSQASDEWATADYRQQMAQTLTQRLLALVS